MKIQNKATMRCCCILTGLAKIKSLIIPSADNYVGYWEVINIGGRNVK